MVKGIKVKRGQWLTHYSDIIEKSPPDVTLRVARNALKHLSSRYMRFLGTRSVTYLGRRYLLITIYNYDKYSPPPGVKGTGTGTWSGIRRAQGGHDNNDKKGKKGNIKNVNVTEQQTELVTALVELTGEPAFSPFYNSLVRRYGPDRVWAWLSETKGAKAEGRIKKSAGAFLMNLVNEHERT